MAGGILRTGFYFVAYDGVGCPCFGILYRDGINFTAPFYYTQYRHLIVNPLYPFLPLGFMLIDLLASDISFIYFDLPG